MITFCRIVNFVMFKKKESVRNKTRFFEIYETSHHVDNLSLAIKINRLIIRYSTRLFGFSTAIKLIDTSLFFMKLVSTHKTKNYFEYILTINKLNLEYLLHLSNNRVFEAVIKKNEWGEFILKNSSSATSRWNARNYLSLLSRHDFHSMKQKGYEAVINKESLKKETDLKFYIYGPNAVSAPSEKYKDYILVFLKPIDVDISQYKGSLLFLNGVYYRTIVSNDSLLKEKLIEKYSKILVSCRTSILDETFQRAKFPMSENLASPMALGRLLYNLVMEYGVFSCVIEGFDCYLDKGMYASYYPTLSKDKRQEQLICSGLASHDALYNFLYIKEVAGMLDITDSVDFKEIIGMSGRLYLDKLSQIRKFETLRQQ